MNQEKKDFGKWWLWVLFLPIQIVIVLSIMGYISKFTSTIVERKVFENSYQRSESIKSEVVIFEATLAEIDQKLSGSIGEQTRNELESQASSIRILLRVAKEKQ